MTCAVYSTLSFFVHKKMYNVFICICPYTHIDGRQRYSFLWARAMSKRKCQVNANCLQSLCKILNMIKMKINPKPPILYHEHRLCCHASNSQEKIADLSIPHFFAFFILFLTDFKHHFYCISPQQDIHAHVYHPYDNISMEHPHAHLCHTVHQINERRCFIHLEGGVSYKLKTATGIKWRDNVS